MNDEHEEGGKYEGLAALFRGDPQQPRSIHPENLFSDFPPFRAATDNMEFWPDLLSNTGEGSRRIALMTHVRLSTLYRYARRATRITTHFGDLIESAQTDWRAFEALRHIAIEDLRRSGSPNADLREWAASYLDGEITVPSKQKGTRLHIPARGVFLATLIAHAEREGFRPHGDDGGKGEQKPRGCEIVESALRKENWQYVPTVGSLEKVWEKYQHFVAHHVEEKKKRSLSEFGVHPESMLAMMARHPSEKFT